MSDILIKGMEMPKSCEQCNMFNLIKDINVFRCGANNEYYEADFDYHNIRHPDCPIVEVPTPHGDLIDSADIIDEINRVTFVSQYDYNTAYDIVGQADVVVEAEVSE